jgi:hypothetical protein
MSLLFSSLACRCYVKKLIFTRTCRLQRHLVNRHISYKQPEKVSFEFALMFAVVVQCISHQQFHYYFRFGNNGFQGIGDKQV